jgi:hemin uptake protein HemP
VTRRIFLLIVLAAVLVSSNASAQVSGAKAKDPALQAVIDARQKAITERNATEWAKYTADNFMLISSDGTMQSRSERMTAVAANTNKPNSVVMDSVQLFGPDAAVTIQHNMNVTTGNMRITTFWIRQAGQWKAATSVGGAYSATK